MARRIEVEAVLDTSQLQRGFRQAARSANRFEREISRSARGAVVAGLHFKGLGRAAAFASTQFLGGFGLAYAIRSTIDQATEQTRVLANLRNALEAGGFSWARYGKQIQSATLRTKELSAFDDEELYQSLQLLLRGTGSVSKALRLNALAADVARGRHMDLVRAAQLLVRVNAGQIGSLRRLGIQVSKNATGQQALAQVQRQYAGAAAAYGRTAAGAQDRFRVAVEDLQKAIGRQLLPTVTRYLGRATDWLNKTRNQQRVIGGLTRGVHELRDALGGLSDSFKALNDTTGSTTNSVKLLLAAFAGFKVLKFAKANPYVAAITAIGVAAVWAAGKVKALQQQVLNAQTRTFKPGSGLERTLVPRLAAEIRARKAGGQSSRVILAALRQELGGSLMADDLIAEAFRYRFDPALRRRLRRRRTPGIPDTATGAVAGLGPAGTGALSPLARNQLALAAAARTKTTADDLRLLRQQREILSGQISFITRKLGQAHGKTAKNLAKTLKDLYDQDSSAFDQITSITDAAANDAKSQADKHRRAIEKRNAAITAFARDIFRGVKLGVDKKLSIGIVNKAIGSREQAAQFRALGLTAAGQERAKSTKWLRRRARQVADKIAGTSADTPGNRARLARIHLVLSGQFGVVGPQVAQEIQSELDDIAGEVSTGDTLPAPRFRQVSAHRLARMLGLGGNRAAIGILAQYGGGGTLPRRGMSFAGGGPGVVIGTAHFHGVHDVKALENEMQKLQRGRPSNRRGAR